MNDPDPPECRKTIDRRAIPGRRVTDRVRKIEPPPGYKPVDTGAYMTAAVLGRAAGASMSDIVGPRYSDKPRRPAPDELPDDLAERMLTAFHLVPGEGIDAMREAYKVFLDSLRQD